ncbi:hypothetical protein [Shewanella aquimarina]|uniref:hypothetical protein n=1 Tax=Shewanella aquimarina TaxID=260365 RepID=UPI0020148A4E|nr:hypothetical protein [Shewanella aquimarina]MCL2909646.1 hypothetical protein [Shewanella aquimarina]
MIQELEYPSMNSIFNCHDVEYGIRRDSQIETIKHYLKENQVLYLNASSSIGKTTILKQVFEELKYDSISLFINKERVGFINDVEVYKDLYIQIKTYMGNFTQQDVSKDVSKSDLEKLISTLSYHLKYNGKVVYFIFDGVYSFENNDNNFLAEFFLMLPTDVNYKYLISRDDSKKSVGVTSKKCHDYSLSVFSLEEIKLCLPNVDDTTIVLIRESFGSSPETISFIKDMVERGIEIDDIFSDSNDDIQCLYENEWSRTVRSDFVRDLIGICSYSVDAVSLVEVGIALDATEKDLIEVLNGLTFLKLEDELIVFKSNAILNFCKKKVSDNKHKYIDILLGLTRDNFDSLNSSKTAHYLFEKNEFDKVLGVISDEHISNRYQKSKSFNEVHKIINFGIKACEKLDIKDKFIKYKYLKSGLSSIYNSELMAQQLKCHIVAGESALAIRLIQKARSEEEMLQLYCIYAMSKIKEGVGIEDSLYNKIDYLFDKIDVDELGPERVVDICADLLPIMPDKALILINKLDSLGQAGQNKSDFAFLNLSLLSLQRHGDNFTTDISKENSRDLTRSTIIENIKGLNKDATPDSLLEFFSKFPESGDRIFLYRAWLKNNKENQNAVIILGKVMDEIIESIEFSIDASLFQDITECLNFSELENNDDVVNKIKSQLNTLKKKGPTVDYCRLVLNIITQERSLDKKVETLNDLVKYIDSVKDLSVKLTCLSHICGFEKFNKISNIILDCHKTKQDTFKTIIESDALHIEILKESIAAESKYDIDNAIFWCESFNNSIRVNKGKSIALYSYLKNIELIKNHKSVNDLVSIVRSISDEEYREDLYYLVVEKYKYFSPSKKNTDKLIKFFKRIHNNYVKSRCLIMLYCEALELGVIKSESYVVDCINDAISNCDGDDNKSELRFYACEMLFKFDRDVSLSFKEKAIEVVEETGYSNEGQIDFKIYTIELAIRSLYILSRVNEDSVEDFDFIVKSILTINSDIKKSRLFSRLVSSYQKSDKDSYSKKIIENHIVPILEKNSKTAGKEFLIILFYTLPVINVYDDDIFLYWFNKAPKGTGRIMDKMINVTIDYLYNDCIIGDPYDSIKNKYTIGYRDLIRVLKLISLIREDGNQFFEIRRVLAAIKGLRKKSKISKTQEDELLGSLIREYIDTFPKQGGISHFGYKILFLSEIKSMSDDLVDESWDELISMARQVNNISDRSFVISQISSNLPESHQLKRKALFQESVSLIERLSSSIEKVNRYKVVCDNYRSFDKASVKDNLKKAFMICNDSHQRINSSTNLEIIDMINSYGDAFSSSLVNMLDNDPARKKSIEDSMKKRKNEEELKKRFQSNQDLSKEDKSSDLTDLLWKQLAIVNSNCGHVPKLFNVQSYINSLDYSDVDGLYKVLSYYIHSLYVINPSRSKVLETIRPLFDIFSSIILVFDAIFSEAERCDNLELVSNDSDEKSVVISEGQGENALKFIKEWFGNSNNKVLTIVDPYLHVEDFEFIANVISKDPNVDLIIVTSLESCKKLEADGDLEDRFSQFWEDNISRTSPPSIDFIFISCGDSKSFPIHDRWWLSGANVVECGTSISGFGNRVSKIRVLTAEEASEIDAAISPYIMMKKRFRGDEKVKYKLVRI